jgi:hypothetical protein
MKTRGARAQTQKKTSERVMSSSNKTLTSLQITNISNAQSSTQKLVVRDAMAERATSLLVVDGGDTAPLGYAWCGCANGAIYVWNIQV